MKKILSLIPIAILLVIASSCSKDNEPFYPEMDFNDESSIAINEQQIPGLGGTLTLSFTTNSAWQISCDNADVVITPKSGNKGNNTITITFPKNPNDRTGLDYYFYLNTDNGDYLSEFRIYQSPAPRIECKESVSFDRNENSIYLSVASNHELAVSVKDADWLNAELEIKNSGWQSYTYELNIQASENNTIEEREGIIILSADTFEKQIVVSQSGGPHITAEYFGVNGNLIDNFGSIPPAGGVYKLKVTANCEWSYSLNTAWNRSISVQQDTKTSTTATFNISASELPKEERTQHIDIQVSFANGQEELIRIEQRDWRLTVNVNNGERLSTQIDKVRDKLEEGYFVSSLFVNNGILDEQAPYSVESVNISNVENIPENFCSHRENLTNLTLSNVKRIGTWAFYGHNIKYLDIPASVTYIGDMAFYRSDWYPRVKCYNPTPPTIGSKVFQSNHSGILEVPMGSKTAYKGNSGWSKQFDIFEEF